MGNKYVVKEQVWAKNELRFLNHIIDSIVIYVLIIILFFILGLVGGLADSDVLFDFLELGGGLVSTIFFWGFYVLYYVVLESRYQVTVGKLLTKTIVVNSYGEKPTMNSIWSRSFSRLIPFDAFSFIGVNSHGWHDSISKTHVVSKSLLKEKKQLFEALNHLGGDDDAFRVFDTNK